MERVWDEEAGGQEPRLPTAKHPNSNPDSTPTSCVTYRTSYFISLNLTFLFVGKPGTVLPQRAVGMSRRIFHGGVSTVSWRR